MRRRQRIAELDQRLRELQAASARATELEAAATAAKAALERAQDEAAFRIAELEGRVAELESALAVGGNELETALASTRAEAARVQTEMVALQEAHDAMASRNADLEVRLKELDAANARTTQGDEHAEDLSHLLFVPGGREGYRLVEQNGPPPIPGSTLQLTEDDGTVSKLLVSRVGPAPLPGVSVACAYLVAAE
ncbi:MAG: hypothetical protein ACXVH1_36865 [Solirubrobacteraceae bacterium]